MISNKHLPTIKIRILHLLHSNTNVSKNNFLIKPHSNKYQLYIDAAIPSSAYANSVKNTASLAHYQAIFIENTNICLLSEKNI